MAASMMKESFGTLRTVPMRKASSMAGTQLRSINERGFAYKELEYSTLLQQNRLLSYEIYVWVHSCVRAIANQVAKLPFKMYFRNADGSPNKEQPVTSGRCYDMFQRPNAMQNYNSFIYGVVSSIELLGNFYLERGGRDPMNPTELYLLRGDWVEVVPDPVNLVAGYIYRPNGVPINLRPYEVAQFKLWHPRSELYGLSPLSAIRMTMTTDMFVQQWQQNFFRQGGVANHYISCPTELDDDEFEELKQRGRAEMSGVDRSHLLGVLDNDMKILTVDDESDRLDLEKLRLQLRNEVLAAFHVPPIWVMGEQTTYNNADAQKKIGYENCIQPLCKQLEAFWDSEFLNADGVCCEYDMSGIHSLQDNEKEKSEVAMNYVKFGIMTPNEARDKFLKLKPMQGGDQLILVGRGDSLTNVDQGGDVGGGGMQKEQGQTTQSPAAPHLSAPVNKEAMLDKAAALKKNMHLIKHGNTLKKQTAVHKDAMSGSWSALRDQVKKLVKEKYHV